MAHQIKKGLGAVVHGNATEFRVWAPFAQSVELIGEAGQRVQQQLTSENDGYWSIEIDGAKPGQNYRFVINTPDGRRLEKNDPYARQLTDSDIGWSVIVDNEFDWEDITFTPPAKEKQIIYELHVGTFNRPDASTPGTFYTAIEKLDYLQNLGITMIELMPVSSMATSNGWGYAPNHIFSVENAYGGRYGLLTFVKECHKRGIGVILDVVYNHFSQNTDLWQFDGWSENGRGGIYFYNDERGDTPWGGRPDYGRSEVRQFILDNVTMWMTEYRMDGLRVDSTIFMRNKAGANDDPYNDIGEAWSLLSDITTLVRKINPHAITIAEDISANSHIVKSTSDGGTGFDAQWELGFPYVLRDALGVTSSQSQARLDGIDFELKRTYNGNAFERVVFSDSHDTAANGSSRLNEVITPGNAESVMSRKSEILANAVMLTSPGIPMLLQGEEFMQQGAFNDWQMLEWHKTEQFAGIVLAHQHLINLRLNSFGDTAGLTGQSVSLFHRDDTNNVIAYHRWQNGGPGDDTIVVVNFDKSNFDSYRLGLPIAGEWRVRFNSSWNGYSPDFANLGVETVTTDDTQQVTLPIAGQSVIILSQD